MLSMDEKMKEYANLIVRLGVNIQKGQQVMVDTPLEAAPLVREIAKAAYSCGAKDVFVRWIDEELTRIKYDMAPLEAFAEAHEWMAKGYKQMAEDGGALISFHTPNPDLLKGVDPAKFKLANKTNVSTWMPFRVMTHENRIPWVIASVPTRAWAAKVLPDVSPDERVTALWNLIFDAVRIGRGDTFGLWKTHIRNLSQRAAWLNEQRFKCLHYTSATVELTIELPEGHLWVAADSKSGTGVQFVPNIPTEEVFTAPVRDGVNGRVSNTKPLNYKGQVIDGFTLWFERGRIVNFEAVTGEDALRSLLETDEGARYLGEVALVPVDSPIHQSGVLFYNTLFDENASSHLAIGKALPFCLENGTEMNQEVLRKKGLNTSLTHVDFMMGSADLDIDGETRGGERIPVFRQGRWTV